MNKNDCFKFECENMTNNTCVYEDEVVKTSCEFCDIYYDCNRCRHKENCTNK